MGPSKDVTRQKVWSCKEDREGEEHEPQSKGKLSVTGTINRVFERNERKSRQH